MGYTIGVVRTKVGDSVRFDFNIKFNGSDVGNVPGAPEIVELVTPLLAKGSRQFSHTIDQYVPDSDPLIAKATLLFDGAPAWALEVNAVQDPTTPTGHAYWASTTCIDPSQPVSISQTIN